MSKSNTKVLFSVAFSTGVINLGKGPPGPNGNSNIGTPSCVCRPSTLTKSHISMHACRCMHLQLYTYLYIVLRPRAIGSLRMALLSYSEITLFLVQSHWRWILLQTPADTNSIVQITIEFDMPTIIHYTTGGIIIKLL